MLQRLTGFFAVVMLSALPASAMDWLTSAELESECQLFVDEPAGQGGMACKAFIQGFLAGADATDATVAQNVKRFYSPTGDSYVDRAAETRLGVRLKQYGYSYFAGYCIGDEVSSVDVVNKVVDYLGRRSDEPGLTANLAVYQALVASYPCDD